MAAVRAVHHAVWCSMRRFREARPGVDRGSSTSRDRLGRLVVSRERSKLTSSKLLQCDLTFGKFLVDEAQLVVLQENLHVELVLDSLLQNSLRLDNSGSFLHSDIS